MSSPRDNKKAKLELVEQLQTEVPEISEIEEVKPEEAVEAPPTETTRKNVKEPTPQSSTEEKPTEKESDAQKSEGNPSAEKVSRRRRRKNKYPRKLVLINWADLEDNAVPPFRAATNDIQTASTESLKEPGEKQPSVQIGCTKVFSKTDDSVSSSNSKEDEPDHHYEAAPWQSFTELTVGANISVTTSASSDSDESTINKIVE